MTRRRRRSRLVALVRRFVEADSWPASLVFLERHAALLTDDADDILTDLYALASPQGDGVAAQTFEAHRAALRRYRKLGAAAFDELIAPGVPAALRSGWAAAETAYERYRARPSRATADSAVYAVTAVLRHASFAAVPAAARAGMHQAGGTLLGERYQRHGGPATDLDAAVNCFTAAVQELPDGAPTGRRTPRHWATSWGCGTRNGAIPRTSTRVSGGPAKQPPARLWRSDGGFCATCPPISASATRCSATRLI